ncbi:MAG TPA: hypothetical protein VJO52_16325 [Gemmatimonadaceae bacterium]|nr:hypothetical protein [Gemmatimonadaceae bacterium]
MTIVAEDDHEDEVRRLLSELPVAASAPVIVSWDADTAVITSWPVFVTYWTDFCYASSDDVTIWEPTKPWTLCYYHYEVMRFTVAQSAR